MKTNKEILDLLRLIELTRDQEIDCTEFLNKAAGYVEQMMASKNPPSGYDDVVQHLQVCPECLEEFEQLLTVLREQQ